MSGAFLSHREAETGSIERGKSADLVVLDRNLLAVSPFDIHKVRVLLTVLEGKVIYQVPALAAGW